MTPDDPNIPIPPDGEKESFVEGLQKENALLLEQIRIADSAYQALFEMSREWQLDSARLDWLEESRAPVIPFHQPRVWICGQIGKLPIGMKDKIREAIDVASGQ